MRVLPSFFPSIIYQKVFSVLLPGTLLYHFPNDFHSSHCIGQLNKHINWSISTTAYHAPVFTPTVVFNDSSTWISGPSSTSSYFSFFAHCFPNSWLNNESILFSGILHWLFYMHEIYLISILCFLMSRSLFKMFPLVVKVLKNFFQGWDYCTVCMVFALYMASLNSISRHPYCLLSTTGVIPEHKARYKSWAQPGVNSKQK